MGTLNGMAVIVDDSVVSVRVALWKPWMDGRCYIHRIQKKWDRRFGKRKQIDDGQVITYGSRLIMNSTTYAMLPKESRP